MACVCVSLSIVACLQCVGCERLPQQSEFEMCVCSKSAFDGSEAIGLSLWQWVLQEEPRGWSLFSLAGGSPRERW